MFANGGGSSDYIIDTTTSGSFDSDEQMMTSSVLVVGIKWLAMHVGGCYSIEYADSAMHRRNGAQRLRPILFLESPLQRHTSKDKIILSYEGGPGADWGVY